MPKWKKSSQENCYCFEPAGLGKKSSLFFLLLKNRLLG